MIVGLRYIQTCFMCFRLGIVVALWCLVNAERSTLSLVFRNSSETFKEYRSQIATTKSTENSTEVLTVANTLESFRQAKDQTSAITIASVAVLIAIVIFICVLYKFHAHQLVKRKRVAMEEIIVCGDRSPCLTSARRHSDSLLRTSQAQTTVDHVTGISSGRRKSLCTPTPPLLSPPVSRSSKRGSRCSTWSNLSEQDVFGNSAPRRHSAFNL